MMLSRKIKSDVERMNTEIDEIIVTSLDHERRIASLNAAMLTMADAIEHATKRLSERTSILEDGLVVSAAMAEDDFVSKDEFYEYMENAAEYNERQLAELWSDGVTMVTDETTVNLTEDCAAPPFGVAQVVAALVEHLGLEVVDFKYDEDRITALPVFAKKKQKK